MEDTQFLGVNFMSPDEVRSLSILACSQTKCDELFVNKEVAAHEYSGLYSAEIFGDKLKVAYVVTKAKPDGSLAHSLQVEVFSGSGEQI